MKRILYLLFILLTLSYTMKAQEDFDQDGMDDAWETTNSLNPQNPNDAWGDSDNDGVLNLFEYLLESSPVQAQLPAVFKVSPQDNIEEMIDNAPAGSLFKLQEGDYTIDYNHHGTSDGDISIMFQGGWNADFTINDPCLYPTTWIAGNRLEIFGVINTGQNANVIFEGISFRQPDDGVSGGIDFALQNSKGNLVVNNCDISNSTFGGLDGALSFFIRDNSNLNCWLINSVIANNSANGINVSVSDSSSVNLNILHSTIYNNTDVESVLSGAGIDGSANDDALLDVNITNSIIYGNEDNDLDLFGYGERGYVQVNASHSIIGFRDILGEVTLNELEEVYAIEPTFNDPVNGGFTLSSGSIGTTEFYNTGFSLGEMTQWGYNACSALLSGVVEDNLVGINVFPNPTSNQINIELDRNQSINAIIELYNVQGRLVHHSILRNTVGSINVSHLQAGMYYMYIIGDNFSSTKKIIVSRN